MTSSFKPSVVVASLSEHRAPVFCGKAERPNIRIDSLSMLGTCIDKVEAGKIIKRKARSMLVRGEPLDRLLCNYVQAKIIGDFPAIVRHVPNDKETIYNNYSIPIDLESLTELQGFITRLPGLINISMDGNNVNGKQKASQSLLCNYCNTRDVNSVLSSVSRGGASPTSTSSISTMTASFEPSIVVASWSERRAPVFCRKAERPNIRIVSLSMLGPCMNKAEAGKIIKEK